MKRRLHGIAFTAILLAFSATANGQQSMSQSADTVRFRFVPDVDMFYSPYKENAAEISRLYALIDDCRAEIASGEIPVYVDGYCASAHTSKENRHIAFIRSNRVKSEMIVHKGLAEDNFRTRNNTTAYTDPAGNIYKDMVLVSLRIPVKEEPVPRAIEPEPEPVVEVVQEPTPAEEPWQQPEPTVIPEPTDPWRDPYVLAIRTNLLHDAFLAPTLGIEWRINRHVGIKLDGTLSWWGGEKGKVQKIWGLSPELRWYMTPGRKLYVGLGGNYAEYNVYRYPLGSLFSRDTGYQGTFWNAGLTVGYQLRLAKSWSMDFNLGLGYSRSEYDSFNLIESEIWDPGADFPRHEKFRVHKSKGKTKKFWGPTQAGVSIMWQIGNSK